MQVYYQGVPLGDPNCSKFVASRNLLYDASDNAWGIGTQVEFGEIAFAVYGATIPLAQADCAAKMANIQTALALPYGDLRILNDDSSDTVHSILNSQTFGGVKPTGLRWSDKPGAQFITWREYSCGFRWNQIFSGTTGARLMDFTETVTIQGGTPRTVVREPINVATSSTDEFITIPKQKYVVQQQGSATGFAAYPNIGVIAPPLFGPPLAVPKYPNTNPVSFRTPQRVGGVYRNYTVTWSYAWEMAVLPYVPLPNLWV